MLTKETKRTDNKLNEYKELNLQRIQSFTTIKALQDELIMLKNQNKTLQHINELVLVYEVIEKKHEIE